MGVKVMNFLIWNWSLSMVIQITWTQGMLKIKYAPLLIETRQQAVRQQTRNRSKKVP